MNRTLYFKVNIGFLGLLPEGEKTVGENIPEYTLRNTLSNAMKTSYDFNFVQLNALLAYKILSCCHIHDNN